MPDAGLALTATYERAEIGRKRRRAVGRHLGDAGVAGDAMRGRDPAADAVGADPGDAAGETGRVRGRDDEAEEDVAERIDGDRRVDEDAGVVARRRRGVGGGAEEHRRLQRPARRIGIGLDQQLAAGAGRVEAVARRQRAGCSSGSSCAAAGRSRSSPTRSDRR